MKSLLHLVLLSIIMIPAISNAQLPVAEGGKIVRAKGIKIYMEEAGKGMPLLLLHGFGRSLDDWKSLVPELSRNHRVIAIDLPGHARSDAMDTTQVYLHKQAAEIIWSFLDSLEIDSLHIMGFSSGGFICLYMATLQPDRVKKIIPISAQVEYSEITRKLISSLGGPFNFVMERQELEKKHGSIKGEQIARQFYHFKDLYGDPLFSPQLLSTIKAEALIVHGDKDVIAPVDNAWVLFKNIPAAHLWIIPFADHRDVVTKENERELIRRIANFL